MAHDIIYTVIKNGTYLEQWEKELVASEPVDYRRNLKIFEAMIEEAKRLGAWPPSDPLEGLEVDIRIAKVVNALKTAPKNRRRA